MSKKRSIGVDGYKCGHEWETRIGHRVNMNSNCPYCNNRKLLRGFNDMWTTNPDIAKLLADPEDGYKYSQFSNKKVQWRCLHCDKFLGEKQINSVAVTGASCPRCSDGLSFGERFMYQFLEFYNIPFIHDKSLSWSNKKRYDFYIEKYNLIIEVHGEQHYRKGFETVGGDKLEDVIINDEYKRELALLHGVNNYIEVKSSKMDIDYLKSEIKISGLLDIINITEKQLVNFKVDIHSNLIVETWNLWNTKDKSVSQIARDFNLSYNTISRYLKIGSSLGKCEYKPSRGADNAPKEIVRLTPDGVLIEEYESIGDMRRKNPSLNHTKVIQVCKGEIKDFNGHKWMYKESF